MLLVKRDSARGEWLIGVSFDKTNNKFLAVCSMGSRKLKHIGRYLTENEAFIAYKNYKEQIIKSTSLLSYELGEINEKVRDALLSYSVEISD